MTSTRPNSPLTRATASATSPWISLELVHPTVSSVREATYLGAPFSRAAMLSAMTFPDSSST
jgi:hypothetical protein